MATDDDESTDAVVSPLATGRTWLKSCSGYGSNLADWLTSSWLKVIEAPVSHVTLGRACHMISRTKQSKGKKGRGKQSKRKQSRIEANQTVTPGMSHVIPGRACHMLPWGARVTCYPWGARCSGYELNLADWLTSSWLKMIEATRTVHAKAMMRWRAGCPLFWLRVEPS